MALVLVSVSIIDSVTERRVAHLSDRARINARWISAVIVLVLAPAGRAMSGAMFLTLVTSVLVAQVVFDMMMAPLEESKHAEQGTVSTADLARQRAEKLERGEVDDRPTRRRDVTETVRKGTPSELRQDLYFYFMQGGWLRVFVALVFVFLVSNVFFACLYLLEPGSITGRDSSFADAFFFSVQTMSTIGYGGLTPATPYANAIVTAEAALSIIGVAIVTGLVFAKVSRPSSSVLFSDKMIITEMHGKRVLMFRLGNARGNEIVDATMHLTVLIDEVSPEGIHMRRLHDVKLARRRTPLFVVTWSVIHEIDEDSPLRDVDWSKANEQVQLFIATVVGHDATYGQTVHARKMYHAENVHPGETFVDILSELPDGRLLIDYARFHHTKRADA